MCVCVCVCSYLYINSSLEFAALLVLGTLFHSADSAWCNHVFLGMADSWHCATPVLYTQPFFHVHSV